jgi:hypothetical protein
VYKGKEKERRQKESGIEKVVRAASIGRFWLLDECRVLFSFPAVVWFFIRPLTKITPWTNTHDGGRGKKRTLLSAFDLALFLTSA